MRQAVSSKSHFGCRLFRQAEPVLGVSSSGTREHEGHVRLRCIGRCRMATAEGYLFETHSGRKLKVG